MRRPAVVSWCGPLPDELTRYGKYELLELIGEGGMAQADVEGHSPGNGDVASCFVDVLRGVRFGPTSDGGVAVVEYTFVLTTEEGEEP